MSRGIGSHRREFSRYVMMGLFKVRSMGCKALKWREEVVFSRFEVNKSNGIGRTATRPILCMRSFSAGLIPNGTSLASLHELSTQT